MAKKFVCVRIQSMNGVNLNAFQFEYELTWMSFFQNSVGRTYTRYGGRDDHDAESHLNKRSLLRVMRQALQLHRDGKVKPQSRYEPVSKTVRTPEDIPTMKAMMAKRKNKCIHCHDVKVAELRLLRDLGKVEKSMVFTYPAPSQLGLHLDPETQHRVQKVDARSPAASAEIRAGDEIETLDGQRVLTFADITRVLELAPQKMGELKVGISRGPQSISTTVRLTDGWRKSKDPSWRQSTGVVGPSLGFWGVSASVAQRKQQRIGSEGMAIRISFIYKSWSRGSGLKLNDILTSIDGLNSNIGIRQMHAHIHLNRNWGDKVNLVVRRRGKDVKISIKLPDKPQN